MILCYKFTKNRHKFDNNLHAPTPLVDISSFIASHPVYFFSITGSDVPSFDFQLLDSYGRVFTDQANRSR